MSLITEALKKLKNKKSSQGETQLPPQLESSIKKDSGARKRFYFLLGSFILSGVSLVVAYYIYETYYNVEFENVVYPHPHKSHIQQPPKLAKTSKPKVEVPIQPKQEKEHTQREHVKKQKEAKITQTPKATPLKQSQNTAVKAPPKIPIENGKNISVPTTPKPEPNTQTFLSYIALAEYYVDKGDLENAIKYYANAVRLKKDPEVIKNLLVLYIQIGQLNKLERFYYYIKRYRNISDAVIFSLAKAGYIQQIKKIADIIPKPYLKNFYYGVYYEKLADLDTTLKYYQKAYSLNQSDIYIGYSYARILEAKLLYRKALRIYQSLPKVQNSSLYPIIKGRVKLLKEVIGE